MSRVSGSRPERARRLAIALALRQARGRGSHALRGRRSPRRSSPARGLAADAEPIAAEAVAYQRPEAVGLEQDRRDRDDAEADQVPAGRKPEHDGEQSRGALK